MDDKTDDSWLNRHRHAIQIVSIAVAFLSLGFTIGSRVGKSFGDAEAARWEATAARAEKIARECIETMQHITKKPPPAPAPDAKPN